MIALSGPLGVGKTTLVRGFLAGLGHSDEVPSPSFAIVQPYEALEPPAWHVDLYRLDDPREVDRCYQLGCSVYITKPVQYQDFAEALSRLGMFLEIIQVPSREGT